MATKGIRGKFPRIFIPMVNTNAKVRTMLWIILFANLLVAFIKMGLGWFAQSNAVLADGFHSLSDGSSNVIGLIALFLANQPEDDDHPYGHAKFETLGSLVIVALLTFLSFEITRQAIGRFFTPLEPSFDALSFGLMVFTLMINLFVTITEARAGRKLQSQLLISDAMHTRSDIFVTVGVISSMVLIRLGLPLWIDSITSLVVAGFILKAALEIFNEASPILLDAKQISLDEMNTILKDYSEIKNIHHLRSRGTLNSMIVDMHVKADKDLSLEQSHALSHRIEASVQEAYPMKKVQVICHMEPYPSTPIRKNPL